MSDAKNHILDKSGIVIPQGTIEDFKRPDHPDFMTSAELAKIEFSGIRHNSISGNCEIWKMGNCTKMISKAEVLMDPDAINKAMEEVFALHDVMPDRRNER